GPSCELLAVRREGEKSLPGPVRWSETLEPFATRGIEEEQSGHRGNGDHFTVGSERQRLHCVWHAKPQRTQASERPVRQRLAIMIQPWRCLREFRAVAGFLAWLRSSRRLSGSRLRGVTLALARHHTRPSAYRCQRDGHDGHNLQLGRHGELERLL